MKQPQADGISIPHEKIKKIIIIKLCCIGDILFTTPLLRALQAQLPSATIDYMTCGWCSELAAQLGGVRRVLTFDAYGSQPLWARVWGAWGSLRSLWREKYDLAIVLHRTPLAGRLTAAAGIPYRVGYDWQRQGRHLTHPVVFRAEAHEVERMLDCLKPLGLTAPPDACLDFPVPTAARAWGEAFLRAQGWRREHLPLVAVFPGGGVNPGTLLMAKRWPLSRYAEVMRRLQEIHPEIQFVFPGDQRDRELGDALAALCPNQRVLRAEGRTTLTQLAAMLTHCRLFIGGDSGPLHLAEAVGVPTLCIFGPTDPALLAPRGPQHQVLRGQVECGPCFTPRSGESPAEGICRQSSLRCMEAVTPQAVAEAALGMLAPDSKPGRISRARRPRA